MKQFFKNRWHLHALTLPGSYFFLWLMQRNFLDLGDIGAFFQSFMAIFASACIAFVVEWVQGAFFGANRTQEEGKASNLDILVSIIASTIGVILFWAIK